MKKNLVFVVLATLLLMPALAFSMQYEEGQEVMVCHHDDKLTIVTDGQQCPGVVHEGIVRGMAEGVVSVQVGDQLFEIPMGKVKQ